MIQFESLDELTLFGSQVFNINGILHLLLRFAFHMGFVIWIARGIYYPITRRKDYLFTYILISAVIFLLCFLLDSVKLQVGFALGLFAVFGIIRYRTNPLPIKEMTYLFLIIGLTVINALASKKVSYDELLFANLALIGIIYGLEKIWLIRHEASKLVIYEKIEFIKPEKRAELLADLEIRTGHKINHIEIGTIDFMKDIAHITIFYYEDENRVPSNYLGTDRDDGD